MTDQSFDLNPFREGKFQFDSFAYPMFVKDTNVNAPPVSMQRAIDEYKTLLHDTHRHGFKETFAVLPSGATPGELCLMVLRGAENSLSLREHSVSGDHNDSVAEHDMSITSHPNPDDTRYEFLLHCVAQNFLRRMNIHVCDSERTKQLLHHHLTRQLLFSKEVSRKLTSTLKRFLKESGLKTKGYTSQLKLVVSDTLHHIQESSPSSHPDNSNDDQEMNVS